MIYEFTEPTRDDVLDGFGDFLDDEEPREDTHAWRRDQVKNGRVQQEIELDLDALNESLYF